jgi:release factor glutamine methyltransferase
VTVLEAIQKSADFLQRKGVESPRLHAELLLAHVLQLPRMKLYLNFERPLNETETGGFRELVRRRGQREPLQHIVGTAGFCGLDIGVNRHVLVPRPETELLAEEGWNFLKGRSPAAAMNSDRPPTPLTALDFGTGSGCIAIAIAAKCPNVTVVALDVSPDALDVARLNASRAGVADRIHFQLGNGFDALRSSQDPKLKRFDLIVSNPPYIASAEIDTLEPEVREFDPRTALDGGLDGLDFYRMLAAEAREFLRGDGRIMLEFGEGQSGDIRALFENQKWIVEGVRQDYTRRERILIARP